MKKVLKIGVTIALHDFLVSISFLVILAIVNSLGVTASAGVGVADDHVYLLFHLAEKA